MKPGGVLLRALVFMLRGGVNALRLDVAIGDGPGCLRDVFCLCMSLAVTLNILYAS